ncbi:MAG TPA: undecaprenyl-diphosphate phosphatase [Holophagaceae bacterium]|nr:undecaprenyl-diphosphate phosphatase [Holophagaceae bacterium]
MHLWHAILLGLIQGLTEFLPVSSTAHLTLAENLLMGQSMPLAFDMLLHAGTLVALIVYFRREVAEVGRGIIGRSAEGRRLGWLLLIAMIPTGILGLLTRHTKEVAKDHVWIFGICLILTAWMLFSANEKAKARPGRELEKATWKDAAWVGAIQGIGGGFGLSRSGSTISVGVFSGLGLPSATRFSFLLGIPTILAASLVEGGKLLKPLLLHQPLPQELLIPTGGVSPLLACLVGIVVSGVAGYFAIGILDRFTRKPRLNGFAFYCLCMGIFMVMYGTLGIDGFWGLSSMGHP